MELDTIDVNRLSRALNCIEGQITKSVEQHGRETAEKILMAGEPGLSVRQRRNQNNQRALEFRHDLQTPSLEYVLALLRYSQPGFDSLPQHEQVGLILGACEYLNGFLESLRKLLTFLEIGAFGGLPNKRVTDIGRDVRAAILRVYPRTLKKGAFL